MIVHFFKTAFRSLRANKVYSILTVAGLGVGIAVFLVIFLFIRFQESYDRFHAKKANIYRILTTGDEPGDHPGSAAPHPMPAALKHDFPDWKVTGIFALDGLQVQTLDETGKVENAFKEDGGAFFVDSSFFSIFDFPWLAGAPDKAMADGESVILTKSTADRYFGDWHKAMGRVLNFRGTPGADKPRRPARVTGILADPPANTDFQLKVVFPYPMLHFDKHWWWTLDDANQCYVLLPAGADTATLNRQLAALSKKYRDPKDKHGQIVEPLADVHYNNEAATFSGAITHTRIRSLWLIAGFVLLIACVNFVNISTAQAVNRAREVGVRKVLGGSRWQLRKQFLLEAGMLVAGGVLLAVFLISLLLVPISRVLEIPLSLHLFQEPKVLLFLAVTAAVVTLLAGSYPAMVISAFKPVTALKAKLVARSNQGLNLRRGLVIVQFLIAQALIMGTLLVVQQLSFFLNAPMGFDKSAVISVSIPVDSLSRTKLDYLRNQLLAIKDVRAVSYNSSAPASDNIWGGPFKFDHAAEDAPFPTIRASIDANYFSTYSMPLVAGRNITRTDSIEEFVVNLAMVEKLGFARPEDVLNKQMRLGSEVGPIVGVVKNFHIASLKSGSVLSPVVMRKNPDDWRSAGIRLDGKNMTATIGYIRRLWRQVYPEYAFDYQFLDDRVAGFYADEIKLSGFYKIFAAIAIFLSCLGLYGLVSFMAAQRRKEVGIRKVLGATVGQIVSLFTREFIWLVGIAFILATPLAWYFVHKWVEDYASRAPIGIWLFVLSGVGALAIALATVGYQALRAARMNPVENLRTE
ncbi:MAG TPA: FtsX-like permease family protein [Puia sp.]|nr:FtsX-like permease family protein [Puia sp.]